MRRTESAPPVAKVLPSGLYATERANSTLSSRKTRLPVAASQAHKVPSAPAERDLGAVRAEGDGGHQESWAPCQTSLGPREEHRCAA